jgi:hypothetical protein
MSLKQNDAESWTTAQVLEWLSSLGLSAYAQVFSTHEIHGEFLLTANHLVLK